MTNLLPVILLLLFFLSRGTKSCAPGGALTSINQNIMGPGFISPRQTLYIRSKLNNYIGQYIIITVTASIGDIGGFSGFLLRVAEDYVEVLCFPYHQDYQGSYWAPYIASIPIGKITSVTHRHSRGY
jgi:hypothetical protein